MTTFNSYTDVQNGLTAFVTQPGVNIQGSPHGAFWQSMHYEAFTTGNIPGVPGGPWPILVVGDSKSSNIIQILSGTGAAFKKFGQMPRTRPPYPGQADLIAALASWIDNNCPSGSVGLSAMAPRAATGGFDLHRVNGTAGNAGTPGAPILHFALLVHASTGKVSGQILITQAVAPPGGSTHINVSGQLRQLGFGHGPVTQLVSLEGTYPYSLPPPAIGTILEQFRASFATDKHWNGRGSFSYGGQDVNDVPVHSTT